MNEIVLSNGLLPVVRESGFRMDDYYVWCGSCIRKENGTYCLFASRWTKNTKFPQGYMTNSEIVLAETDSLDIPFHYVGTILGQRDKEGRFWDSLMAHNPQILTVNGEYLLFYIGTPDGQGNTRKIGIAHSEHLENGWVRPDQPLELPENANNPSAVVGYDGKLYLAFRDGQLKVSIACADTWDKPFRVIAYDIFPKGRIEDMYFFRNNGHYEIIAEDNQGTYTGQIGAGVHFCSDDCIRWDTCEPMQVYDRSVTYTDGTSVILQRRERPMLLQDNGRLFLFTTAKIGGETRECGGITWNMVQEYRQ